MTTLRILGEWLNLRLAMMRNPLRQVAGEWRRECECDDPLCGHIHRWDNKTSLNRPGLHKLPNGDLIHVGYRETDWGPDVGKERLEPWVTEFGYSHSKPRRDPTKLYESDYFETCNDPPNEGKRVWGKILPKSPNYAALLNMIKRYGALWQWRIDVIGNDNMQRIIALGKKYP